VYSIGVLLSLTTKEISCYQQLVKRQLQYLRLSQSGSVIEYLVYTINSPYPFSSSAYCKTELGYCYRLCDIAQDSELVSCLDSLNTLISRGVLIELGRLNSIPIYTTLHADIVFRVIRGRAYEDDLDGRWVGNYVIEFEETILPNFNAVNLDKLKELLIYFFTQNNVKQDIASKAAKAIVDGLYKAGFKSLAEWQFKAIEKILLDVEDYYVVDAPTATGKTLVFMVPALAYSLLLKLKHVSKKAAETIEYGALLAYPRIALQRQQLETLLKIVHHVNEYLRNSLGVEITIAIDKGREQETDYDVKELFDTDLGGVLQGKLIQERYKVGSGLQLKVVLKLNNNQKLELSYFKGIVLHPSDREYILMESPDILITNPWTIRERIKSTKWHYKNSYLRRTLIVLDEAHVYTNVNYIDLVAALKLYKYVLNEAGVRAKYILSSATIPLKDKRILAQWIWGLCKDNNCGSFDVDLNRIVLLDYSKLEPINPNRVLKIIITLFPYRLTIETMVQGLVQVLVAALLYRSLKAIVFIDSISEVSTLIKYIDTIFNGREGIEVCDHILNIACKYNKNVTINPSLIRNSIDITPNVYDDYSWSHLWHKSGLINKTVANLLNDIQRASDIIREHHGALSEELRRSVEQGFVGGLYKILIATSTLDLGVNFDDVTFIVQYKEPMSDEALIQRVGRAGRRDESYRIALAFYIPTHTPIQLQTFVSQPIGLALRTTLLPHPAVMNKLFNIEFLEYEIKNSLFEFVASRKKIPLSSLRRAAINTVINILSRPGITAFIPQIKTTLLNQIRSFIKNIQLAGKQLESSAKGLADACKSKSAVTIRAEEVVQKYVKRWIKSLTKIFSKYAELSIGLGLLSSVEASKYLNEFAQEINEWINRKPTIQIMDQLAAILLPTTEIPPLSIDMRIRRKPNECKKALEDFNNNINKLIDNVTILRDNVKDIRLLVLALFRSPISRIKIPEISTSNFESVWYIDLRNYVLECLRLFAGLVSRVESDSIELNIR